MSVIFKTLTKLKDQSVDENERKRRLKKKRVAYSLRTLFLSPSLLLLFAVLVFIAGFGALYGIGAFRDHINTRRQGPVPAERAVATPGVSAIQNETGTSADTPEIVQAELGDIPSEPEHIPDADPQSETPRIIPGRLIRTAFRESAEAAGTSHPPNLPSGDTGPVAVADTVQTNANVPVVLSRKAPTLFRRRPQDLVATRKEPGTDDQAGLRSANQVVPPRGAAEQTAPDPESAGEQISQGAIKKRVEILKLVSQIEKSMGSDATAGPDGHIETLIERLASIKGDDQAYILKMKAYVQLRNKAYGAAAGYLEKVLDQNADDVEAGINMAIIEIYSGQVAAARKRLGRLREIYPENVHITKIVAKLGK